MSDDRAHDIVVFGATGFVGRLIAAYLAEQAPQGTKIALGGRSKEKLDKVRSELPAAARDWPLVTADSSDRGSIDELARSARVVATTVGPYRRAGVPLVEACADAGTHYCDLTGEILFVRECMEYHERAAASGARIVNSCGFDSIPSDIGVHLLHEAAGELEDTTLVVTGMSGGMSGGTLASLKGQVDDMKADKEARKALTDPYGLSPDREQDPKGDGEGDLRGVKRDPDLGQWIGPFVMATYNTRIVRRSNALQDYAYGKDFRYREVTGLGSGPTAPVVGAAMAGGLGALATGLALPPTRKLLDAVLPDPGEGPSEKTRDKGYFKIQIRSRAADGSNWVAKVAAQGDPGYKATAMMFGESALCLALDRDKLPQRAGVLTPASAMDGALADRLRAAGMTLEVARQ